MNRKTKKLVIITGYFQGESYGLLGPQMAATIINSHTDFNAIVLGVTNENDFQDVKSALNHYFGDQQKILGFSSLGGRSDLFDLAGELKEQGAITNLDAIKAIRELKSRLK